MSQPEKIVVRVVRGTCADEETCAAVTRVEHDQQWRYLIGEPVTDPAILAAHADRMAAHEVLLRYPAGMLDTAEAAVSDADVERLKECGDFWLIDDAHVIVMHYGPDGQFVGAERAEDVAPYRDIARLAEEPAEPFAVWWARHEEYHRNPKVA